MINWTNDTVALGDLKPWGHNPRRSTKKQARALLDSMAEFGQVQTIAIGPDNEVYDGHQRLSALLTVHGKGYEVDTRRSDRALTDEERRRLVVKLHAGAMGEWDFEELGNWDMSLLVENGFDQDALDQTRQEMAFLIEMLGEGEEEVQAGEEGDAEPSLSLVERFGVPPFSVLDARQGYWQDRKRAWLGLGLRGEVGRFAQSNALPKTFKNSTQANQDDTRLDLDNGTSIFDPVLCELAYTWFTPQGAAILDPFSGGSVRGIVASYLGRHYTGIDLRPEQIAANVEQGAEIVPDNMPRWIVGDSLAIGELLPEGEGYDFIFSCPPYADLEVYSDDPRDISTMGYSEFVAAYREIIRLSVSRLRPNRFACFVVGEARDKNGNYYNFVGDTIKSFLDAGCSYYNDAVLVTPLGTVMMQTSRNFPIGRKLGKTHQDVLVFVKGDGKKAAEYCGVIEIGDLTEEAPPD